MDCTFKLITEFGEFKSKVFEVLDENFSDMCSEAEKFYSGPWSMQTDEGFIVIPPEICRRSILIINKYGEDGLQK